LSKTLYYGDNLSTLKVFETESVDLIYLDPPYNSKRIYNCSFGGNAQAKAFDDNWRWDSDQDLWLEEIREHQAKVWSYLDSLLRIFKRKDGLPAYLVALSVRLVELHRVLKQTGSLYLHVDPTASHYVKIAMDQIFGGDMFRNEIVWTYATGGASKRFYAKKHDTILFYTKSDKYTFNSDCIREPRTEKSLRRAQNPKGARITSQNTDKLPTDVFQVQALNPMAIERMGYPTQKPVALLERIVLASSNVGDLVLDPYMGSGTTIEVAERNNRNWIGLDITHHAVACTNSRLSDRCGLSDDSYQIIGVPADIDSAIHLWNTDPIQFEAWAILNVRAFPHQTSNDHLIGLRPFNDIKDSRILESAAVYVVSQDHIPSYTDLSKLKTYMSEHSASIGYLISFGACPSALVEAMSESGVVYQNNGSRQYPTIQHITIKDIIENPASAQNFFCLQRNEHQVKILDDVEQEDLFQNLY